MRIPDGYCDQTHQKVLSSRHQRYGRTRHFENIHTILDRFLRKRDRMKTSVFSSSSQNQQERLWRIINLRKWYTKHTSSSLIISYTRRSFSLYPAGWARSVRPFLFRPKADSWKHQGSLACRVRCRCFSLINNPHTKHIRQEKNNK